MHTQHIDWPHAILLCSYTQAPLPDFCHSNSKQAKRRKGVVEQWLRKSPADIFYIESLGEWKEVSMARRAGHMDSTTSNNIWQSIAGRLLPADNPDMGRLDFYWLHITLFLAFWMSLKPWQMLLLGRVIQLFTNVFIPGPGSGRGWSSTSLRIHGDTPVLYP